MQTIYTATVKFEIPVAPLVIKSTRTWSFKSLDERQKFVEAMQRAGRVVKTDVEWVVDATEAANQVAAELELLNGVASQVVA